MGAPSIQLGAATNVHHGTRVKQ